MALKRDNSLMSIFEFAGQMDFIDLRGLFGVTTVNCVANSFKNVACEFSWPEYQFQRAKTPSRTLLTQRMRDAEHKISEKLGYFVGPTYLETETTTIRNWNDTIKTDRKKVIAAGTQIFTRVGDAVPFVRTFYDSGNWGFNDTVRYTFGDAGTPFNLTDAQICNLFIFPANFDLEQGYRLRPFDVIIDGDQTHIDISVYISVNPEEYNQLPLTVNKGLLKDIDICDTTKIIDDINLYVRSFELPAGTASLSKFPCTCTGRGDCEACQLPTIDICITPLNPEEGIFLPRPIINTEDDPQLPPCWEESDISYCCTQYYGDSWGYFNHPHNCFCSQPIYITYNYLSGCGASWGDICIPDEVCEKHKWPVALLTAGLMPQICDCGCLDSAFGYYQRDLRLSKREGTRVNFIDKDTFALGSTQGAVDAWTCIQDDYEKRHEYAILF